jgi:NADPH:quinone reductase-like Zn-dependent oxidoreductase
MKAIVYHNYGSPDVLELEEIENPVIRDDQVLIKVHAASANPHDWHFFMGTAFMARLMAGLLKPRNKVLGVDVAGRVEAVGPNVKRFQPGDGVFGLNKHGCFAGGGCSTRNLDLVRSLGADQVVDYTQEDFAQSRQRCDLIFDAARKRSFSDCKRALGTQGIYVTTEFSPALLLRGQWISTTGSQKMVQMLTQPRRKDLVVLVVLTELFQAGKATPLIGERYDTLRDVPEALRYIGKGHTQGKAVITV